MSFKLYATLFFLCTLFAKQILANVEKTIFLGPPAIHVPHEHPNLEDLYLQHLTPLRWSLPTELTATFPTGDAPKGTASWFLLSDLKEGQRYEVRICWAATQPTKFWLDTYTLNAVFDTPDLISSLATFSESRQPLPEDLEDITPRMDALSNDKPLEIQPDSSILFLQVYAAADYVSTNKSLMEHVPFVVVDIILDPFILNVFPRSLIPTAGYLVVLAVFAWFVSGFIFKFLDNLARSKQQVPVDGRDAHIAPQKEIEETRKDI
ncbi:hypothetical protein L228DRAFT_269893 [Xylona heveae TC161]|uniref:Uncharacterized protein n=1 Tax=Xylona heveae (strain CBS 132557 / TC161) TaxID=1328760 RepID=A0A165AJQ2_XYLHT|nr:hypothetical protein L228DRAFT_269893 [Xylona heveae TC161]KZF20591.1 hypothetical protein L228DRAFT_269893 [Xylona heveae TC161]